MRRVYPYLFLIVLGIVLAVLSGCAAPAAMPTSQPAAATEAVVKEGTEPPCSHRGPG